MDIELKSLEQRLARGLNMLRDLEEDGQTGPRYERMLRYWLELLAAYELRSEHSALVDDTGLGAAMAVGL